MNPYVIHCASSNGSFIVRAIRFDCCRIVSEANYHDPISARMKASHYSRTFAHEGTPAPIVYGIQS